MIGSPVNSLIPGPTPDPSRSLSGAGSSSAGPRSVGAGSAGSADAGVSGPRFADHLRDASGRTTDRASERSGEGTDATSVLPPGYTPERTGHEYSRPISLDAVRSADGAGQGHAGQAGGPAKTSVETGVDTGAETTSEASAENRPETRAETRAETTAETVHPVVPDSAGAGVPGPAAAGPGVAGTASAGFADAVGTGTSGTTGIAGGAATGAGAVPGATATSSVPGASTVADAVIVTGTPNPSSTVFNPLQNPAHASQQMAVQTPGSHLPPSSSWVPGTPARGEPPVAAAAAEAATAGVTTAGVPAAATISATAGTAPPTAHPAAATIPATAGIPAAVVAPAPPAGAVTPAPAVRAWTVQQLSTPVVQAAGRAVSLPNGTHLATVRISPEALGPVTIEATSRDGVVRLEMTAATEAGRENLRAVLGELRRELAGAHSGATLDLSGGSSGHRDANAAGQGTGPSPGGRGGDGKDHPGDGVGNAPTGATVPGTDLTEPPTAGTGLDAGPDDGTGGLDVYA